MLNIQDLHYDRNNPREWANVQHFVTLQKNFHRYEFTKPSPLKAPWHVQLVLTNDEGEDIIVNYWPHKMKAYCPHVGRAQGLAAVTALTQHAIEKNNERCHF